MKIKKISTLCEFVFSRLSKMINEWTCKVLIKRLCTSNCTLAYLNWVMMIEVQVNANSSKIMKYWACNVRNNEVWTDENESLSSCTNPQFKILIKSTPARKKNANDEKNKKHAYPVSLYQSRPTKNTPPQILITRQRTTKKKTIRKLFQQEQTQSRHMSTTKIDGWQFKEWFEFIFLVFFYFVLISYKLSQSHIYFSNVHLIRFWFQ